MHTHTYAHEYTCACMTPSTRWSTDTQTHNLCTNIHTHKHPHVYKRVHIHIHTHMHIHTYIHFRTYTHIHICTWNHAHPADILPLPPFLAHVLVSPFCPVGSAEFCQIWPPTVVFAIADSPLSDYPKIRQFWIRAGKGWEINSSRWKPWIRETALPPTNRRSWWQSAATQIDLLHLTWLGVASHVALRATPEHITNITFLSDNRLHSL